MPFTRSTVNQSLARLCRKSAGRLQEDFIFQILFWLNGETQKDSADRGKSEISRQRRRILLHRFEKNLRCTRRQSAKPVSSNKLEATTGALPALPTISDS